MSRLVIFFVLVGEAKSITFEKEAYGQISEKYVILIKISIKECVEYST